MARRALLVFTALLFSALTGTGTARAHAPSTIPVQPLLPELEGRTFQVVGSFSDDGGDLVGLDFGTFLELRFGNGTVVARTVCGGYTYPPLTVEQTGGSWYEIDFGAPTGPDCADARVPPPSGTLFWSASGGGDYALGNGYTGLRLVEPAVTWWRSSWFVVPVVVVVAGVLGWWLHRRRSRGPLAGELWPPGA